MVRVDPKRRRLHLLLGVLVLLVATACSSNSTEPGSNPGMSLALSPTAASVAQGASTAVTATLTRTGGFTGAVSFTVSGVPTGVTGAVSGELTAGDATTATVTINVGPSVAVGTHAITVRASGSGVSDATAAFNLTVTAAPAYTLAAAPGSLSVAAGSDGTTQLNLARTNFTGPVALTLEGAPAGVTGAFAPASATGNSSTLTLSVGGSVAAGTYTLTVRGTATGLTDRTATISLTVTTPPPFTIGLEPSTLSIVKGEDAETTVTITRNNFSDAVALSLGGAPAGVSGVFDPTAPTGTTSTLTISVDGTATPGTYNLTVTGTSPAPAGSPAGEGSASAPAAVDQSASLTLTVTAAPPPFTLSMSPTALAMQQGASSSATIDIDRSGSFTDAVTLSVTGAPAGLTATPDPASAGGATATLNLTAAGNLAPGTYTLTIHGNATGVDEQTTTFAVTVTAPPSGSDGTFDFSLCQVEDQPVWFAIKDGNGAWTPVAGSGGVYTFAVASAQVGVAWATDDGFGTTSVSVQYMTKAELTAGTVRPCENVTGKTINGTVAGIGLGELALMSLGRSTQGAFFDGPVIFPGVDDGAQTLVGYRRTPLGLDAADRMLIRRNVDIADGGSLGTIDFEGAESFAPLGATMTLVGPTGGESIVLGMNYLTATGPQLCTASALYNSVAGGSTTMSAYGAPNDKRVAGDFHGMSLMVVAADLSIRTVAESFAAMANRTLTLGAALPAPTVTSLGGPYKRLQAAVTVPAEYNASATFVYADQASGQQAVAITATSAFLGGTAVTLAMPDFSSVGGWNNAWAPPSGQGAEWGLGASGGSAVNACTEGARAISVGRNGSIS